MQVTEQRYYTPEEYLTLEEAADYKSEYIDGQIFHKAGESTNHNLIAGNLSAALNFAFKTQEYDVFMSDVRLWIPKRRIYTYPDVMVIAGEADYYNNRTDTITNPQVIIEISSKSTQRYDRSDKFQAYRTIPSFREYLLLDQTKRYVEHFSKIDAKQWSLREYDESDEVISFSSIDFEISLTDAYNKVKFEPEDTESE